MPRSSPQAPRPAKVRPARRAALPRRRVLHFEMPSTRRAVGPTVELIIEAVRDVGLSADQTHDLAVAVAEALSNAAVHGNHLDPRTQVVVTVEVTPHRKAVVAVADSGTGFDHAQVSDPTDPARILHPAGRGVFLMRRLVDRLAYNAAGNRVRLTMRRRPAPKARG